MTGDTPRSGHLVLTLAVLPGYRLSLCLVRPGACACARSAGTGHLASASTSTSGNCVAALPGTVRHARARGRRAPGVTSATDGLHEHPTGQDDDHENAATEHGDSSAHDPAAGPQGPAGQDREDQDARAQGEPAAPRRVHARLHDHAQEAELGAAQGRARPPHQRHRGHGLHPGRRPQPAGALDRARPRRPCEGPPGRPLQDHPRLARHPGRQEPQAGPQPYGAKKEKS